MIYLYLNHFWIKCKIINLIRKFNIFKKLCGHKPMKKLNRWHFTIFLLPTESDVKLLNRYVYLLGILKMNLLTTNLLMMIYVQQNKSIETGNKAFFGSQTESCNILVKFYASETLYILMFYSNKISYLRNETVRRI